MNTMNTKSIVALVAVAAIAAILVGSALAGDANAYKCKGKRGGTSQHIVQINNANGNDNQQANNAAQASGGGTAVAFSNQRD
jgi:hypothetical protein